MSCGVSKGKSSELSVADFGAVPDDGLDDTAAIQAALNALKPGSTLVFPSGVYEYAATITVAKADVTLVGKAAVLQATNPESQALLVQADGITVEGFTLTAKTDRRRNTKESARLVVYGASTKAGWITGTVFRNNKVLPGTGQNSSSSVGIFLSRADHFVVENNEVRRTLADGIHITGGSRYGRVKGNTVAETGDDMIAVVSYMGKDWLPQQAKNSNWVREQALQSLVHDVVIENNIVSGQYWGRGITVVGGDAITISGNQISNTTQAAGILIAHEDVYGTYGAHNILIEANEITDVQTNRASFMPSGVDFAKLHLRRASGLTTGHAAIEIHSLTEGAEDRDSNLRESISIDDISVVNNTISRTKADAIRIGVTTPGSLIGRIGLRGNRLSSIGGEAIRYLGQGSPSRPVNCSKNWLEGRALKSVACGTFNNNIETAKGANLKNAACQTKNEMY